MAERRLHGLQRVLGTNALFSTAYGNVGSSIYYALGLVALHALGLTPLVFMLAGGIVDRFRDEGRAIFGPTRAAAEIETSKAFAKGLLREAKVPTARAIICTEPDRAKGAARAVKISPRCCGSTRFHAHGSSASWSARSASPRSRR